MRLITQQHALRGAPGWRAAAARSPVHHRPRAVLASAGRNGSSEGKHHIVQPTILRASHPGRTSHPPLPPPPPAAETSFNMLEAFFVGRALAEVVNERLGAAVGDALAEAGKLDAELRRALRCGGGGRQLFCFPFSGAASASGQLATLLLRHLSLRVAMSIMPAGRSRTRWRSARSAR